MSKRGPGEVTNKERGAPAGGEPHPERVEPLLVREESREDDAIFNQEGLNGDEGAKDILEETQPDEQIRAPVLRKTLQETAAAAGVVTMHYGLCPIEKGKLKFLNSKPCYTFNCDPKTFKPFLNDAKL